MLPQANQTTINSHATHPLQSYEWGIFRERTGIKVVRDNNFQLTIHKIPHTPWTIGYIPKGLMPTKETINKLLAIGKENKCIFIQLEPNIENDKGLIHGPELKSKGIKDKKNEKDIKNNFNHSSLILNHSSLTPSAHPLFTKYTLVLDLTKSEEELLASFHPKTRYNIKVAQKHGVEITEDNSDNAFETYWRLMEETTKRQKFYAHTKKYHKLMWETLKNNDKGLMIKDKKNEKDIKNNFNHSSFILNPLNKLTAHLFIAKYKPTPLTLNPIPLTAWVLFTFKDTLYYPYGASSRENREVMAQNLMMWEVIKFGKKLGLKKFDMWGSLGPNPDTNDPWYGFHRFKLGYSPKLIEFIGSYDLVINPLVYKAYIFANKLRWIILKIFK